MRNRLTAGTLAGMTVALTAIHASQDWVPSGVKDGVVLAFREVPSLGAREVRAIAEIPHAAERILPIVCDFTQALDPDVQEAKVRAAIRFAPYVDDPRDLVVAPRYAWSRIPDSGVRTPAIALGAVELDGPKGARSRSRSRRGAPRARRGPGFADLLAHVRERRDSALTAAHP